MSREHFTDPSVRIRSAIMLDNEQPHRAVVQWSVVRPAAAWADIDDEFGRWVQLGADPNMPPNERAAEALRVTELLCAAGVHPLTTYESQFVVYSNIDDLPDADRVRPLLDELLAARADLQRAQERLREAEASFAPRVAIYDPQDLLTR